MQLTHSPHFTVTVVTRHCEWSISCSLNTTRTTTEVTEKWKQNIKPLMFEDVGFGMKMLSSLEYNCVCVWTVPRPLVTACQSIDYPKVSLVVFTCGGSSEAAVLWTETQRCFFFFFTGKKMCKCASCVVLHLSEKRLFITYFFINTSQVYPSGPFVGLVEVVPPPGSLRPFVTAPQGFLWLVKRLRSASLHLTVLSSQQRSTDKWPDKPIEHNPLLKGPQVILHTPLSFYPLSPFRDISSKCLCDANVSSYTKMTEQADCQNN